jgi:hypothetical protein
MDYIFKHYVISFKCVCVHQLSPYFSLSRLVDGQTEFFLQNKGKVVRKPLVLQTGSTPTPKLVKALSEREKTR